MEWEWQSVHNTLFLYFSIVAPSHWLQFSTNCSIVDPFNRVHSFRNGLLQRGSPTGHKACQKTCSCVGFSPQAAFPVRSLHHRGPPWAAALTLLRDKGQPSMASLLDQTTRCPEGWLFPVPVGADKTQCLYHSSVLTVAHPCLPSVMVSYVSHSAPL